MLIIYFSRIWPNWTEIGQIVQLNKLFKSKSLREVKVPVLDYGGLFKDYDFHKVTALSADIAGMDALSLNYWLSKFVMEVA